jgi:hypothetical protein
VPKEVIALNKSHVKSILFVSSATTDGNGRMGRLWQTLILSKWKSVLAYMPVETIVRNRQNDYYASLGKLTHKALAQL